MRLKLEPAEGLSTKGTKVFLDGVEITGVTGINLDARVNDVWRCTLDLHVIVDGFQVDTTTIANEVRTYRKANRWELLKALFQRHVAGMAQAL